MPAKASAHTLTLHPPTRPTARPPARLPAVYFYYGCTTVGLKPFANVVTELQLTQFVTMMTQAIVILAFGCAYPNRVTGYYLAYILSLFMLFRAFYTVKYVAPKDKGAKKAEAPAAAAEDPKARKAAAAAPRRASKGAL